ncbi:MULTISPECIES: M1 family metallopeptidase [unclassified Polaribacter]|uniref:M1 family metallopeptidase n=1 Tax=unclassified Polaribacter TaxID=196858 RepID=UPI0011BD8F71|nr:MULTISPECIES: M1 family aminopeptidase [unclassified Polaribacter]TXD50781.1 peptidase M1 [Polaribacter sp. IC063]TXD57435.1 peptidase M1 [Polaribacter sp. IC066]
MKYLLATFAFFFLMSCAQQTPKLKLEKGISYELANYRKQQIADVVYNLHFKILKEKESPIPSKLEVNFTLKDLQNDVILDFNEATSKLKSIKINGVKSEIKHQKEHIIIDQTTLVLGGNCIEILFDAGESSLNRNDEFLYTLLVPDRASTLFPCFDQPDMKANYNLKITAPTDWKVLAGGFEKSNIEVDGFTEHTFATSDLISTYLFSFVVGKFAEQTKNPGAFDMRFLYRENNQEKMDESVDEVFKIHQNSIDFLEAYTAVKFPFQKMDFAAIPPFQYGGMEHVGAIQYRESSLFLDKNATQNKKLGRAKLIAHETAHMWFGDLVTMKWFNDVWMKEVFANFMADKIINPVFPEVNHTLSFMMSHYPSAYSEDRTKGTNAIRQYLGNLKDAGSLYGRIIYNKAPIMMRQLEYLLGDDLFQEGIQEYIKTYQNSNADWNELITIFDKKSAGDLKSWSDVWVNSSGRPIFSEEIEYNEKGNVTKFIIHQNAEDGSEKVWTQSFKIQLKDARGYVKNINIKNMGKSFDITAAAADFKPGEVLYNTNGFGYGVFPVYKDKINTYKDLKDEVSRGYQFINLYENMLLDEVVPKEVYKLFLSSIIEEKNELILNYLTEAVETIFWTFLTEAQRDSVLPTTEQTLQEVLHADHPKNIKKIIYNLLSKVGYNESSLKTLYGLWNSDFEIENLFLNEDDFTSLAINLAILNHPKASEILSLQQTTITNKDRLERFKWLLPSLSSDENERDAFMKSLLQKENREKEAWVQTALSNMHHPLRQKSSTKHLKSILETLEEVQLTGDIFFPKGWLASSIGNYSSKEAAEILKDFLEGRNDYNPILLKKLLQTTDNLTRAQKIKK